ncbi:MAG: SCO family protein [Wenzhouxiangella sp.]
MKKAGSATTLLAGLLLAGTAMASDLEREAINYSQAALGNQLSNMELFTANGERVELHDYIGKPLAISMIFTACVHSCSVTTRHLNRVVQIARNALGDDSFHFLTIGFDHPVDTPAAMSQYARRHGANNRHWEFLSSDDPEGLERLMADLGFMYQPSPRGYDHTVQVSIIDPEGHVHRQVYGEIFATPLLVEPMKNLVLGRPAPDDGLLTRIGNRVRLFCTVYDARGDRYYFDYSLFVGIFIGILVLGTAMIWLGMEIRRRHVLSA